MVWFSKRRQWVGFFFICTRLDYCNALYLGIRESLVACFQCPERCCKNLQTPKKRVHMMPVLISLHWLTVKYRIQYKVLMFIYKALHNQAPEYIKDMLIPYQSQRHLRSSQNMLLTVPWSRLRSNGDRAFSVAAPALWHVLPLSIKSAASMDIFFKWTWRLIYFIKLLAFNWVGELWWIGFMLVWILEFKLWTALWSILMV